MVQKIREVEQVVGRREKAVHPVEAELRTFARRSIFATRVIAAGEALTPENTAVLRCGKLGSGLDPSAYETVLGRRAARTIPPDTLIALVDLIDR
jgi:sialic acid synthase SpsE